MAGNPQSRAQQLREYLAQVRERRFQPGVHDCGTFVAGWVVTATGTLPGGDWWRGAYRSMKSLDDVMREAGYAGHVEYIASLLTEIAPAMAMTGDLAVVEGHAMGIFSGERVFVLRPDGLGHVSRMQAKRALRV